VKCDELEVIARVLREAKVSVFKPLERVFVCIEVKRWTSISRRRTGGDPAKHRQESSAPTRPVVAIRSPVA